MLAPIGRDALEVCRMLTHAGVECTRSQTMADVVEHVRQGVGSVLLTEESLTAPATDVLAAALAEQPSWSDVPILLLLASEGGPATLAPHVEALGHERTITVLQRPVPAVTLVSAVQVSLRSRQRQYAVRDLMLRERRALQSREDILAIVSHDLRNPLTTIELSTSDLLCSQVDPPMLRRRLEMIRHAAERMEHMINDLLDIATIDANALTLDRGVHDMQQLIPSVVEAHEPMAIAKGIELRVDPELPPVCVSSDRARIEQVFANLIGNAIKYGRPGDSIRVGGRVLEGFLELTVADTGPGISADQLPHVFERYWTAKRLDAKKGTGLGLYICKGIIAAHGGSLSCESTVGVGTTFRFTLPRLTPVAV